MRGYGPGMITDSLTVDRAMFEQRTGWQLTPDGACKGAVCIPLSAPIEGDTVDLAALALELGLPLVEEPNTGIWAVGPESIGSHTLTTAQAPDLRLPDLDGNEFALSSLRGQKVLLVAWAPY